MPVLETVKLSDLLDFQRQNLELVAWAQGQGDAFGCDKFVMLASIPGRFTNALTWGIASLRRNLASLRTY